MEEDVLVRLKTRGSTSSSSSSSASLAIKGVVSSSIFFILGARLGEEEEEVGGGTVCVWAVVVDGVGTDGGLEGKGCCADVGGGGGLVCV